MQEVTLERQAFDAHMRINNGLTNLALEHVSIDVTFADETGAPVLASSDPNNTQALFFIRLDTMDSITNISGSGIVSPSTSADIHWLIIPAPGASKGVPTGTLYYVGANLHYTLGGEEHTTNVTPDYIFVKPMPELTLDYFLPTDVYADDPFTTEIEPPVAFTLGVRVANKGTGVARAVKIASAQPKIVDNQLGLLIGFNLEGCEVNGAPKTPSLLADFGDIQPNKAGVARWVMTTNLSGRFTEFSAEFSHSDELGGELTSLIKAANTHFLVHDVLVDAPGKDGLCDFLAKDGDVYRVYESENIDTVVTDLSSSSTITPSGDHFSLQTPPSAGFMNVRLADPTNGQNTPGRIVRSDNKLIKELNVWISKTQDENHQWHYYFNLFDVKSTGSYTVRFVEPIDQPHAPVMQFVPNYTVEEGKTLSFIVTASDQNGTTPFLRSSSLPARASFTDQGNATGIFRWTPAIGQAGLYQISFTASDGSLEDTKRCDISVTPTGDSDNDGMPDAWELAHFGTLDRDGRGDFDGDGISDLDEYLRNSDPTTANKAPSVPIIVSPADTSEATTLQPVLAVQASTDADGDPVTYTFEVATDAAMTTIAARQQGVSATSWTVPAQLNDNTWYFWRVQASDGFAVTTWAYGRFFINPANDAPTEPQISSPFEFDTNNPSLTVTNAHDVDEDVLTYSFFVYADSAMTNLVASATSVNQGHGGTTTWPVTPALRNNTTYNWKARVADEHGLSTESALASFLIHMENTAPAAPVISLPAGIEVVTTYVNLTAMNSVDAQGDVLSYFFELDTVPTFDSGSLRKSDTIAEHTLSTSWQVIGLADNTVYYWRVKASDGMAESPWTTTNFFVNTTNDAPITPTLRNPANGAWVNTLTPTLEISAASDIDHDAVTYLYEVYADDSLSVLVASIETDSLSWTIPQNLTDETWYSWRVRPNDEHGLTGSWMPTARFYVDSNGVNDAPVFTFTSPAYDMYTNGNTFTISWDDNDPDSDARISFYYSLDNTGMGGTLITDSIHEDPDGPADTYQWNIAGLAEDTYHLYAVITDGATTNTIICPYTLTIDRSAPTVEVSPAPGSYTTVQNITMAASEPADIYYTLDGLEPTTSSTRYTQALEISRDTTIKFMAVDRAGNSSLVWTAAYAISVSNQQVSVLVTTSSGSVCANIHVFAFTEGGAYTNISSTTDISGVAVFNTSSFTQGRYKFRVDYLGSQFWSQVVSIPGAQTVNITIAEELVQLQVNTTTGPAAGVRVYLFRADGTYLGSYVVTDASGIASFRLPAGVSYKFRVDILGSQYWSNTVQVLSGGTINVPVNAGGGVFTVTVQAAQGSPLSGISAYLFSTSGTYLGLSGTTDSTGAARFNVPTGEYKVRADYKGYQFWSADTPVSANASASLTIPHRNVQIAVNGIFQGTATAMQGIKVYLFTPAGSYLGQSLTTDSAGRVSFSLPEKAYKVRSDYLGFQFFSKEFTWQDTTVLIPMADAQVTLKGSGMPRYGVNVDVFTLEGSFLGITGTTDSNGRVVFSLPVDSYAFRADFNGSQYWSDTTTLLADQVNPVDVNMGGGAFTLMVLKGANDPLSNVRCYVFDDAGSYLGMSGTTDASGQVKFDLTRGDYQFRIDYLGTEFWTLMINVPATLDYTEVIAHRNVTISIAGKLASDTRPLSGIPVYLFNLMGSDLSKNVTTNAAGQVTFSLPEQAFRVRSDYLGKQYFSDYFIWQDAQVNIYEGIANVFVNSAGQASGGVKVYVFSPTDTYLGVSGTTNTSGIVQFRLPADSYKFRADYQGSQFWMSAGIAQDVITNVNLNTGGGQFTLSVDNGQTPLVGVKAYVFSPSGTYLGMTSTTNASGQESFALARGSYKFRVDHQGYQFWSDVYTIPTSPSGILSIPHRNVTISVQGWFDTHQPMPGIRVYLFTQSGTYLGTYLTTAADGTVVFTLPDKQYKVRCDYLGLQFWSDVFEWQDTTVTIHEGLARILVNRSGVPQSGAKVYLFSAGGSYLGLSKTTDAYGETEFILPAYSFKFRIDQGSLQKWTPLVQIPDGDDLDVGVDLNQ